MFYFEDFQKAVEAKNDFNDDVQRVDQRKEKKRLKRKARREKKTKIDENEDVCSCLCHFRDKRSNSLSIIHTRIPSNSLVKSQSCPTLKSLDENLPQVVETVSTGRCSSARTDLGYSSGLTFAFVLKSNQNETKTNVRLSFFV